MVNHAPSPPSPGCAEAKDAVPNTSVSASAPYKHLLLKNETLHANKRGILGIAADALDASLHGIARLARELRQIQLAAGADETVGAQAVEQRVAHPRRVPQAL